MNRINKYKESIYNFFNLNNTLDKKFKKYINTSDFTISILFLTILNIYNKNTNNIKKRHGYYIIINIEYLLFYIQNKKTIETNDLIFLFYNNFITNIIKYKDLSNDTILLMNQYINKNLKEIFNEDKKIIFDKDKLIIDNTLIKKYDSIKTLFFLNKNILIESLLNTYYPIIKIAIILGWLLSDGDIIMIINLERVAYHFSILYKIYEDFKNITYDLDNIKNLSYSLNFIINIGIDESYFLFLETKKIFLEICIELNILTNSIEEIINKYDTIIINNIKLLQ